MTEEWKVSAIISTSVCRKYLSISFVVLTVKLYNRKLLKRKHPHVEPLLGSNQYGFGMCRSAMLCILALHQIIESAVNSDKIRMWLHSVTLRFTRHLNPTRVLAWMMICWDVGSNYGLSTKVIVAVVSMYSGKLHNWWLLMVTAQALKWYCCFSSWCTVPYLSIIDCVLKRSIYAAWKLCIREIKCLVNNSQQNICHRLGWYRWHQSCIVPCNTMTKTQSLLTAVAGNAAAISLHINTSCRPSTVELVIF